MTLCRVNHKPVAISFSHAWKNVHDESPLECVKIHMFFHCWCCWCCCCCKRMFVLFVAVDRSQANIHVMSIVAKYECLCIFPTLFSFVWLPDRSLTFDLYLSLCLRCGVCVCVLHFSRRRRCAITLPSLKF